MTSTTSAPTATSVAITAERLRHRFGKVTALDGLSLEVADGSVLALLGPNGAGKTTLVRILATLLRPDAGRATVHGHDVIADAYGVRRLIGLAGQTAAVDEFLTGREVLVMVGRLYHLGRSKARTRAGDVLERFDLGRFADRRVGTYSGGMRRRLDLAATLVGQPRVVFLDEPTTGLDPRSRTALWELVDELRAGGTTVLLTTQYLEEADRLADRIAVIDHGRLVADGTPAELKAATGSDRLVVQPADPARLEETRALLAAVADAAAGADRQADGRVSLPVTSSAAAAEAIRLLDRARIGVEGIEIRKPSLDDVFVALTGRHIQPDSDTDTNGREPA